MPAAWVSAGTGGRFNAMLMGIMAPDDWKSSSRPFAELLPGETVSFKVAFIAGLGYYDAGANHPDPSLDSGGLPNAEDTSHAFHVLSGTRSGIMFWSVSEI